VRNFLDRRPDSSCLHRSPADSAQITPAAYTSFEGDFARATHDEAVDRALPEQRNQVIRGGAVRNGGFVWSGRSALASIGAMTRDQNQGEQWRTKGNGGFVWSGLVGADPGQIGFARQDLPVFGRAKAIGFARRKRVEFGSELTAPRPREEDRMDRGSRLQRASKKESIHRLGEFCSNLRPGRLPASFTQEPRRVLPRWLARTLVPPVPSPRLLALLEFVQSLQTLIIVHERERVARFEQNAVTSSFDTLLQQFQGIAGLYFHLILGLLSKGLAQE
jgi:hypothetical protein